jgi:hypothetical protein
MPGAAGRGKIHEKSQGKVVGGGGVRSSYIRRTRKRQGVGLTTEGRRGNARAGTSEGVGRTPGLGQEGAPARARPAGREAGGRRGAGMLPGGQRTGARQGGAEPRRVPGRRRRGRQPGTCWGTNRPEQGTREGVHEERTDRRLTGAARGGSRAGRNRRETPGRGPEGAVTPAPAPACHRPAFSREDKARKHQFRRPWKALSGGNGHQCEPPRMTPRPCQLGLT